MNFNSEKILEYQIFSNSVEDILVAAAIFIITYVLLKTAKLIIIRRLKKFAETTKVEIDDLIVDIIHTIKWPVFLASSLFISAHWLYLHSTVESVIQVLFLVITTFYVIKLLHILVDFLIKHFFINNVSQDASGIVKFFGRLAKLLFWIVGVIIVLQNIGFDVTTVAAGLGITGIAIAFALQNILQDIFSSISIYFDKPFEVGDLIFIGDDSGVVQKIGIKTTRIKTLQGEELVISNSELTNARVRNFKKLEERRVVLKIGVSYETDKDKLESIPILIKRIIDKIENARFGRAHLFELGDFSINYEVVFYVESSEYGTYMDLNQKALLAILAEFEDQEIEIAYPTQSVILQKKGAEQDPS